MKTLLKNRKKHETEIALLFLAPSFGGLVVFWFAPFALTVYRSFTDVLGKRGVGFSNYRSVLENSAFQLAAVNTLRFLVVCLPLLLCVSLVLAICVRALHPEGRRFKTTFLLPMALLVASMVILWKALFSENGLLNDLLTALDFHPVDFMGTDAAFWVLVVTYLWKNGGYDMILWLAGLDGIPGNLYEAAQVDGANPVQQFWYITLPQLRSTLGLTAVLSLLNMFKVFREAYLVAGSYPHESMYLLQHLFNNWFLSMDLGRLCAAAVLLALTLLLIVVPLQFVLRGADDQ